MTKAIGTILKKVVRDLHLGKKLLQYEVVNEWEKIVGKKIASVTTAEKVVDGKLIVRVNSSAWRNELSFLKREIIKKINNLINKKYIKKKINKKFMEEIITDIIFK